LGEDILGENVSKRRIYGERESSQGGESGSAERIAALALGNLDDVLKTINPGLRMYG
jgi:hypothetical protein